MQHHPHHFSPQTTYVIRFENSNHHFSQFGWFLALDLNDKRTQRAQDSNYIIIQRPIGLMIFDYTWKLTPTPQGAYVISMATGLYKGYELYSYANNAEDQRDIYSYRVFLAPHDQCNSQASTNSNKWRFQYMGDNVYMIQNAKTGRYMSAHRYYKEEMLGQELNNDRNPFKQKHNSMLENCKVLIKSQILNFEKWDTVFSFFLAYLLIKPKCKYFDSYCQQLCEYKK